MKKSIYNHLCFIENRWVLYNALSDELAMLDSDVKELFVNSSVSEIETKHPDFYQFARDKKFIIPTDIVESDSCIAKWEKQDNDMRHFSLTINPTLDCNMRCWYCYEKHSHQRKMTQDVMVKTCKFIENSLSMPKLESFDISFFGGEPLIEYKRIVQPIINHTIGLATAHEKKFSLNFVTNGFLLSNEVISYLSSLGIPVSFQITLDGNEEFHNKTRHTVGGKGSYTRILENCKRLLEYTGLKITLRLNYTNQNADSFIDVLTDIMELGIQPSESIHVDFQRVWQDVGDKESVEERIDYVRQSFAKQGFSVSDTKDVQKYRCYADGNNHIVINYDGNLYHCTARDFTKENSEGVLLDDGTLQFNERSALRSKIKWGNPTCQACRIYPICQGLCSQNKLDHMGNNACLIGYSEKEKDELLVRRIKYLVKQSKLLASSNSKH